jgi:hypothetical protein
MYQGSLRPFDQLVGIAGIKRRVRTGFQIGEREALYFSEWSELSSANGHKVLTFVLNGAP